MYTTTRRTFFMGIAGAASALSGEQRRVQVAGEWCFVKFPRGTPNGQVVLTLHGAGEWVNETTSSWEQQPGATRLMEALLEAGFAVAQSNSAARHGNGMWGNRETQSTTAAFVAWLRDRYSFRTAHAVAVSAGNLILTNLLLRGRVMFDAAVMLAPCLSLESEYRCPGGVNRVKTIAEAYGFTRSSCPGDPQYDQEFLDKTEPDDPLRTVLAMDDASIRNAFGKTRWMAVYESGDPRVPPGENLRPFAARLNRAGITAHVSVMQANTHGSQELFLNYVPEIVAFVRARSPQPDRSQGLRPHRV